MPRRIHPSLQREQQENEFHGGPGDALLDDIENEINNMDLSDEPDPRGRDAEDDDEDDSDSGRQDDRRSRRDPRDDLIESLQRRLDHLERMQTPATARQPEPESDELDDVDWDAELFADPKGAMKKHGEIIAKRVAKQVREEYQQDQSSKEFWRDFYSRHKDLKEDHDLVESTLGKNMSKLANMPSTQAIDRLADLTRERISRYSGRGQQPRRKAMAEGASDSAPRRVQQSADETRPKTITDYINLRRTKRLRGRSTAA